MKTLLASLALIFSSNFAIAAENLDSTPDLNGWGLDLSFGNQPYMEFATRISILSPHLFSSINDLKWRATFDFMGRNTQTNDTSVSEFGLSLESNSAVYRDVVYSFAKFGVSAITVDDSIYDETIISVPLSFGLQAVVRNTERFVMSYFIDYRFSLFNTYDEDEPTASVRKEELFSGVTSFGLRLLF